MNIYHEWGFQKTPFDTLPLPPDEDGKILMIDREKEILQIKRRLSSSSNILTIEGTNGIGKTSLVNVSSFELFEEYLSTGTGPFLIPCDVQFQITPEKNAEEFIDEVFMAVAQTLLRRGKILYDRGYTLTGNSSITSWLNEPQVSTYNGGVNSAFFGIQLGKSSETNTSIGYQRSGFRTKVLNWLKEIFPYNTNGGVVCVIDNMELLQTSQIAKKRLEEFRDTILSYTGLRWVLCGSLGIVKGVMSTPRLQGRLYDPIEVCKIEAKYASEILSSRISYYELEQNQSYLPLTDNEFKHLYEVLNNNTRNTLNYANNYCFWVADNNYYTETNDAKKALFNKWLYQQSSKKVDSIMLQIKRNALVIFNKAISLNGEFSPGGFEDFGFNSFQAMRPYVSQLERAGLVTGIIDESDKRRKTIQVTDEGWLFNYGLNKGKL